MIQIIDGSLAKVGIPSEEEFSMPATGFDIESKDSLIIRFIEKFETKYNYTPGWVEAHCYDAISLIIEGLRHSKDYSGVSIKQYLDDMGVFSGVTGEIKFDENGDVIKPVYFKQVKMNSRPKDLLFGRGLDRRII